MLKLLFRETLPPYQISFKSVNNYAIFKKNPKTPKDFRRSRRSDPIGSTFCPSCFFVKHYAHTKFHSNRSIIKKNPRTPEDSRRSDRIGSAFCPSSFFVKHCPHTKFHSNLSRMRPLPYKVTKIAEDTRRLPKGRTNRFGFLHMTFFCETLTTYS